jgi:predicted RNA-binding Zn ribbon-like protein
MELPLWSWLIEPLAIDFANSTRRRGMVDQEYFRTGADVASWCEHEGDAVPSVSAASAAPRLAEIRAVRDDVKAVLRATVDGVPLPARATARLNARARELPVVGQLGGRAGELRTVPARRAGAVDELLARVAAATIELVGSCAPVQFCDAPSCGQFYVPDRPNQVWCDPSCGTRARVARHAAAHSARRG